MNEPQFSSEYLEMVERLDSGDPPETPATEELIARRSAADCSDGWLPIDSAPQDGTEIIVYCPPAHGLNHMASVCAWHEDTGFCVDELREPSLWIPLPNVPAMAYADTQTPPKKTTP